MYEPIKVVKARTESEQRLGEYIIYHTNDKERVIAYLPKYLLDSELEYLRKRLNGLSCVYPKID